MRTQLFGGTGDPMRGGLLCRHYKSLSLFSFFFSFNFFFAETRFLIFLILEQYVASHIVCHRHRRSLSSPAILATTIDVIDYVNTLPASSASYAIRNQNT